MNPSLAKVSNAAGHVIVYVFLRDLISGVRNRIHDNLPNIIKDA